MHANRMQSMGDINIYEFNEKSQLRSPSWAKYTAIYGNWIIWELFHTTAVEELKTGMKSSGEAKLWNYEVVERVVKSSGEPKSQSYNVVEASRNSGEAMSQSCEVTMLRSSQTGPMSTQLQCTMRTLSSYNSSGLFAPGDILKNPQKYMGKRHFF